MPGRRPKTPAQHLSQAVEVLFRDSRGKFKDLAAHNLARRPEDDPFLLREGETEGQADDAVETNEVKDDAEAQVDKDTTMSFLEMVQLKQELSDEMGWVRLGVAGPAHRQHAGH